ncbi:MAG: hypothetical protein AAGA30_02600 [Planctomycetota bacterium]
MNLSNVDNSLLLAAFFRGNTHEQEYWTSCSDQIVTLSLYYTGDISAGECESRFSGHRCVGGLYDSNGDLQPEIESRYNKLIDLIRCHPSLIEGGGDFVTPAYPTFTACRLTADALKLVPDLLKTFPRKPDFPNWPDRRKDSDAGLAQ